MIPAPVRPLAAMLAPGSQASTRATGTAERVALPPLPFGRHMLARLTLHEEPADASWRDPDYLSVNPFVASFQNVAVHGPAGIVHTASGVVAETLWQTDERAGYTRHGDRIVLAAAERSRRLAGPSLSLLGGNFDNLYHWMLEGIGRLAAADAAALNGCARILVPAPAASFHHPALALAALDRRWPLEVVAPGDVLQIEWLVVPWTMTGHHRPHPALHDFFAAMTRAALTASPSCQGGRWPRLLYVDRRGSPNRRLSNEAELVAALVARGFTPVCLEGLPLAMQIALFAHAEFIVAPHGAGLAHLIHAQPGCRVLELHTDSWVNWCFRRLAAIAGLQYDCVVGRQDPGTQPSWVHARHWSISLTHVMAAIDQMPGVPRLLRLRRGRRAGRSV